MRLKKILKQEPHRLDLRVLEKLATPFRIELKNRFDTLKDEEPSIEKMNTILRESMDTIENKTQKPQSRRVFNPYLTRKSSESSIVGPREPRLDLGSRPGRFGEL